MKKNKLMIAAAAALMVSACAPSKTVKQQQATSVNETELVASKYTGPKRRIGVVEFENKSAYGQGRLGGAASDILVTELVKSGKFIVATESGIIHQMQLACPEKIFLPAPSIDSTCGCNDCSFMKLNTLKKLYLALKYEQPEIILDEKLMIKARKPIQRMLELSKL